MKKALTYIIFALCIPLVLVLGSTVFEEKQYAFIIIAVAVLSCVPFLLTFENKKQSATKLMIIAVMTALSVVGRILFSFVPAFKPVTAMVIITSLYFGSEAGFMTGALTALISNFYFMQGPWTPFQMFSWGIIGFLPALFAERLKKSRVWLCVFGAFSGVLFSMIMDIWSVLWQENSFNFVRYLAVLSTSLPFTVMYAVSNVIFLLVLFKPIGSKLQRIKDKYGI